MGIFDKISGRIGDIVDEVRIPEELHRRHENAVRALEHGDADDALAILQPTLIRYPNIARTHHLIARAHAAKEEWEKAVDAYDRANAIRENSRAYLECAEVCEKVGRLRDAEKHLRRALEIEEKPAHAFEIHLTLGRVNLALNRPDRAARELNRALKVMPGDPEAATLLADALMRRGAWDDAYDAITTHIETPESHAAAAAALGRIHEARGRWKAAADAYDAALDANPEEVEALAGAGRVATHTGDVERACVLLDKALGVADQSSRGELYTLRGEALEAANNPSEAARAFRHALELDARMHRAALGLARIELARDNFEVAGGFFQSVLSAEDASLVREALWGLGASRRMRGDLAGARHLLDEALRMSAVPDAKLDARIWRELGHLALEAGDAAEATVAFREARDADPRLDVDAPLHDALERLSFDWQIPESLDGPFELTTALRELVHYLSADARLGEFLPKAQAMLARMDAPLSLAIVGEFNAGKSTIVNALIGESVLPMGVLPTTAHTGIIRFGPRKAARVNYLDGRTVELDYDEAKTQMKTNTDDIDRLEFIYPHPALRVVEYWDTPGFNAINERHEEVAAEALARAEAILWVMDANQVLSQTEFDRIDTLPDGDERLVVVINKVDRLGPPKMRKDAVEELLEYVDDHVGDQIVGSFAMSALQAFEGDEATRVESGFKAFEDFIDERIVQKAGRIKTIEVRRELDGFLMTLDAFQVGLRGRLAEQRRMVAEARAWLEERSTRLEDEAQRASRELDDAVDFMLSGIEKEIVDALRPGGTILNKLTLNDEDREFITSLLFERLGSVLDRARRDQLKAASAIEAELAERLDPVVRKLGVQDARAMNRRIEGFFDDTRTMKALLEERVYRHFQARAQGRIDAASASVLQTIEAAQNDRGAWRTALRSLIPSVDTEHARALKSWLEDYFDHTLRFLQRVDGDLELLELDATHRYDISEVLEAAGVEPIS